MTDKPAPMASERRVAVLHRAGDTVRILIASTPVDQAAAVAPTAIAWREIPADEGVQITQWIREQDVQEAIVALPAAAVICHTCTLPDTQDEHLKQALALQVEAHLMGDFPRHRTASAVLPIAAGETSRSGIMVAWPETGSGQIPVDLPGFEGEIRFAPDVAALAALLNGQRPEEPHLWFDRRDGSVTLAISHANGAVFRAARVSNGNSGDWADNVARVVAETALSVGHTPDFIETVVGNVSRRLAAVKTVAALDAPPQLMHSAAGRLANTPTDPDWWRDYGVAAGVVLARTGDLKTLTLLRHDTPVEVPTRVSRVVDTLSNPNLALKIAVVGVLIIVFGPLVFGGLRLGLLKLRLSDLGTHLSTARRAEDQLAMYRELKDKAWPMSKLLADIACNTPDAIDLEMVQLKYGQRIRLSGRARPDKDAGHSAQEVVAVMQENLRRSGIFSEIHPKWGDPTKFGAYQFTLQANVSNPYRRFDYSHPDVDLDYGVKTLAERIYGKADEPESSATLVSDTVEDAESQPDTKPKTPAPARQTPERRGFNGRERDPMQGMPMLGHGDAKRRGSAGQRRPDGSTMPGSRDVPEAFTPDQIAAMDLAEAQESWSQVATALQRAVLDEETRKRLLDDFRAIKVRVRELKARSGP